MNGKIWLGAFRSDILSVGAREHARSLFYDFHRLSVLSSCHFDPIVEVMM